MRSLLSAVGRFLHRTGIILIAASGAGALMGIMRDTFQGEGKWFYAALACFAAAWALKTCSRIGGRQ